MKMIFGLALVLCVGVAACYADAHEGTLRQLQFSPDGKYVIAQDDSEITVLTVEPFAIALRIPAANSTLSRFTPDSQEIVFASALTQVDWRQIRLPNGTPLLERWSVHKRERVVASPVPPLICGTAEVAPDGRTLACDDLQGTLHIINASSGKEVLRRRGFIKPHVTSITQPWRDLNDHLGNVDFKFSTDGRFLVARGMDDPLFIWDAHSRLVLKPRGKTRSEFYFGPYTFLGPDRLATRWYARKKHQMEAEVLTFPEGFVESAWPIPRTFGPFPYRSQSCFRTAADPGFLIMCYWQITSRGVVESDYTSGRVAIVGREGTVKTMAVELKTGLMIPSTSQAFDVFGTRYVEEERPGEVALWEQGRGLLASVVLHGR